MSIMVEDLHSSLKLALVQLLNLANTIHSDGVANTNRRIGVICCFLTSPSINKLIAGYDDLTMRKVRAFSSCPPLKYYSSHT